VERNLTNSCDPTESIYFGPHFTLEDEPMGRDLHITNFKQSFIRVIYSEHTTEIGCVWDSELVTLSKVWILILNKFLIGQGCYMCKMEPLDYGWHSTTACGLGKTKLTIYP
jgi:hypothetical protein